MLPFMLGAVNTDRFYEPESRSWCQPLAPDLAAAVAGEARPPVVDGNIEAPNMTATEAQEAARKAYEPMQRSAEALIEPILDATLALVQAHEPPKLRRRV